MKRRLIVTCATTLFAAFIAAAAAGAGQIQGQVMGAGAPIANSTVTLWAATADAPKQLAQTRTGADGSFALNASATPGDATLYLVAKGGRTSKASDDNPAIALLTVLGNKPPAKVTINEFTTIASVWTHNQFIDGTAIKGHALQLKIAAGNVPSFVDLSTGGWGTTIQDPLNSSQTPTMANFATLADALAGCVTRVTRGRVQQVLRRGVAAEGQCAYRHADRRRSRSPAIRGTSRERVFALLERSIRCQQGKIMRAVPFMPYLSVAPSAWVLPLKFDGGGYRAGGKAMFDSEGNLWVGDNFTIGWQGQDTLWQGNFSKFAPERQAALADHYGLFRWRIRRAAPSAMPLMPTTMSGSLATAANRSPSSIRTASHSQVRMALHSTASSA